MERFLQGNIPFFRAFFERYKLWSGFGFRQIIALRVAFSQESGLADFLILEKQIDGYVRLIRERCFEVMRGSSKRGSDAYDKNCGNNRPARRFAKCTRGNVMRVEGVVFHTSQGSVEVILISIA